MIVTEHIQSDATSTNTLVCPEAEDSGSVPKAPRYLVKLLLASIFMSLFAFTFSLVDTVPQSDPIDSTANILACILTLPHHCAALLVVWLQRHQSESIFPFTPYSTRAVGYNIFLAGLWVASTTMCAIRLNSTSAAVTLDMCWPDWRGCVNVTFLDPEINNYWASIASTVTTALAFTLVSLIALVCYAHGRRTRAVPESSPTSFSEHIPQSQAKVISA